MELVSLGKEALQNIAEHAASYRLGQSVLRQLDRALWVVEKCARWAVPPPLDADERPQPELVRPLPWVFFLMMLIVLRITREFISLIYLAVGEPPLRSADVVMYIQSKRRYLRTLKYQGNRMIRARTSNQTQECWYNSLHRMFELTMCFRKPQNYGNNNTTHLTNNDEVMVVKRNKRGREDMSPGGSVSETTMERLIEKMMLDLDAESDEDSSYTLTNATSSKSDRSELTESEQDTVCHNRTATPTKLNESQASQTNGDDIHFSPNKIENSSSTPEKVENVMGNNKGSRIQSEQKISGNKTPEKAHSEIKNSEITVSGNSGIPIANSAPTKKLEDKRKLEADTTNEPRAGNSINEISGYSSFGNPVSENTVSENEAIGNSEPETFEETSLPPAQEKKVLSPKQISESFIHSESSQRVQSTPKKTYKIANGRTVKSGPSKKKGSQRERRDSSEVFSPKDLQSNNSF